MPATDAGAMVRRLSPLRSVMGITRLADITGLDRIRPAGVRDGPPELALGRDQPGEGSNARRGEGGGVDGGCRDLACRARRGTAPARGGRRVAGKGRRSRTAADAGEIALRPWPAAAVAARSRARHRRADLAAVRTRPYGLPRPPATLRRLLSDRDQRPRRRRDARRGAATRTVRVDRARRTQHLATGAGPAHRVAPRSAISIVEQCWTGWWRPALPWL